MIRVLLPVIVALLALDVVFSVEAASLPAPPKSICSQLQRKGIVKDCQEGTPWAFEVVRHGSQWKFHTTNPELFGCYRISGVGLFEGCHFEGAITQFASVKDLNDAITQIINAHHYENLYPQADIVAADTTLEHHTVYAFSEHRMLIMMPRTENSIAVEREVEGLLGPSD
jgi:hypothetical protein